MNKKILLLVLILLVTAVGYTCWIYCSKRPLITPFPYTFTQLAHKPLESEVREASEAQILIIGDQMALNLKAFTPGIISELAHKFKSPPKIYNWSAPHEGLHRTLFKLNFLKKFPSIVIYHGASSELYEKIFSISDKEAILKNFATFDDEKIISLIITFPWLSKIFYKKMHYFDLDLLTESKMQLDDSNKLEEKEISFKLFTYQIRHLIGQIKENKSNLILMTTPLNLEIAPHQTCSIATSDRIIDIQKELEMMIKSGDFKSAYRLALPLTKETYSNATSFYLLGKTLLGLGDLANARLAFQKATVFDCANWRGNAVYNAIMKSEAALHDVRLIDFDQAMAFQLSKEGLFSDDYFPQNLFYQMMIVELLENIKKLLGINN